jgi:hypothetical protein
MATVLRDEGLWCDGATDRITAMPPSSLVSEGSSPAIDQFTAEFAGPTRARQRATHAAQARNTSCRRRFVDPTTCERNYSEAELEFILAMQEYKRISGRMFPTWSEVLEVLRGLGYEKQATSGREA